jgi:hypothetical protein
MDEVKMSGEQPEVVDVFYDALRNESFRRRLTEYDELESIYDLRSFYGFNQSPCEREGGVVMTISDMQRQTVRDALVKSKFHDEQMQQFAEAPSFELGDVLSRAEALAAQPEHPDAKIAGDIIVMIRNFT